MLFFAEFAPNFWSSFLDLARGSHQDRVNQIHTVTTSRNIFVPTTHLSSPFSRPQHNGRQHLWSTRQIRWSQTRPPRHVIKNRCAHFSRTDLPGEAAAGKFSVVLRFVCIFSCSRTSVSPTYSLLPPLGLERVPAEQGAYSWCSVQIRGSGSAMRFGILWVRSVSIH